MRIGILTLPLHTNYGGILQAYALQTVLERMGHDVVVFDSPYQYKISFLKKIIAYPKRFICKYVFRKKGAIIRFEEYATHVNCVKRKNTQPFINKYVHRLELTDFRKLNRKDFDAIVVGSDQIWRPKYYPTIENAFLSFSKNWNIKRIAYAPSFGVDNWEYNDEQTETCKILLGMFDAVSVREKSGQELCRKFFCHDAECVLDPTMLLNSEDYIKLFKDNNTPQSDGTLLDYMLDRDDNKIAIINEIATQTGTKSFRLNSRVEDYSAPLKERVQPAVEKWLRGFYDAKFIVTDSFHACVFSIMFRKQFFVVANRERGMSRLDSLLGYFGLTDRIVSNASTAASLPEIDYKAVYEKLEVMRIKSMDFLKNAL